MANRESQLNCHLLLYQQWANRQQPQVITIRGLFYQDRQHILRPSHKQIKLHIIYHYKYNHNDHLFDEICCDVQYIYTYQNWKDVFENQIKTMLVFVYLQCLLSIILLLAKTCVSCNAFNVPEVPGSNLSKMRNRVNLILMLTVHNCELFCDKQYVL